LVIDAASQPGAEPSGNGQAEAGKDDVIDAEFTKRDDVSPGLGS
jgi:hypothetical protein